MSAANTGPNGKQSITGNSQLINQIGFCENESLNLTSGRPLRQRVTTSTKFNQLSSHSNAVAGANHEIPAPLHLHRVREQSAAGVCRARPCTASLTFGKSL